jgi:hypothetical protein
MPKDVVDPLITIPYFLIAAIIFPPLEVSDAMLWYPVFIGALRDPAPSGHLFDAIKALYVADQKVVNIELDVPFQAL